MVGTGVFTTLGLQAELIADPRWLLASWLIGGVIALCGALSYGELGACLPRSGGEYHFLSRIYHPVLGIAAGLISVTVGFAAPVALAAMALGRYAATIYSVSPDWIAVITIVAISLFHGFDVRVGQRFQVITTILKLVLIGIFIAFGLLASPVVPAAPTVPEVASAWTVSGVALALIFVFYAYSGWNAAAYVAGEIEHPERVLPRALLHGTLLVMVLYLLLNFVFLRTIAPDELRSTVEIGALSAAHIFGSTGGKVMSGMLCLLLVSTISAMVLAGPRVLQTAGEDIPLLRPLARRTAHGAPAAAILLQQLIALVFVATGSFEDVLALAGFTLTLFASLTVLGVIVLRVREPQLSRPWGAWGYPWTQVVFLLASLVVLVVALAERPLAAAVAAGITALALVIAFLQGRRAPPSA